MDTIKRLKISVAVITYNQETTIRQTLDSILAQKGDFDLELVIGEDCSSDSTRAICEEYTVHPTPYTVVLLPSQKNLGIMANFARVMKACTGEFISGIAGDDYYSDDYALEKQLKFLQSHPDVGVVAANGCSYYVQRGVKVPGLNPIFEDDHRELKKYYFSSLHLEGVYLAPVGMMFRADLLNKYIDFDEILRRKLPVEDYPIQAILSQYTKFACLPDLLVTYRVYKESATFMSYDHPKFLAYYRGLIDTRRYLNELFPSDAIPEEQLQELLFHKEFMLYLYQLDYTKAKQLIASSTTIVDSEMYKRAKRVMRSYIHFVAAHYIKKYKHRQELKRNI